MEDAATAEISRAQLWQWVHHGATLDDGRTIDRKLYEQLRDDELGKLSGVPHLEDARQILDGLVLGEFVDFLTLPAVRAPGMEQETPGATQAEIKVKAAPLPGELVAKFAAVVGEGYAICKPEQLRTYESDGLASFRATPGVGRAARHHRGGAACVKLCAREGVRLSCRAARARGYPAARCRCAAASSSGSRGCGGSSRLTSTTQSCGRRSPA